MEGMEAGLREFFESMAQTRRNDDILHEQLSYALGQRDAWAHQVDRLAGELEFLLESLEEEDFGGIDG